MKTSFPFKPPIHYTRKEERKKIPHFPSRALLSPSEKERGPRISEADKMFLRIHFQKKKNKDLPSSSLRFPTFLPPIKKIMMTFRKRKKKKEGGIELKEKKINTAEHFLDRLQVGPKKVNFRTRRECQNACEGWFML
ncbi:hypothetical protein CEXT_5471 [Caerostris extrusa]|uniref:Uncharacterized protein n=1 Tax=Caerostris extrusa TaxID=172846 RepID=A0AAV4XIX5_CAEEX|nr:hypothetical protein CEXT_5471 [Caerostris extrusa]